MRTSGNTETADAESMPTLNQDLLGQYRQRRSGLLERLIEAYLEEAPRFLKNIRQSNQGSDFADLKLNAHALKSCSYNLGAVRLSRICQGLENAANAKDGPEIAPLMERIGPEFFEVEEALKTEMLSLKRQPAQAAAEPARMS
jgi:HPt (histidine-containing phosphotransfer) domain-containing protein